MTADELELLPTDDSMQCELDEGELIRFPFNGEAHGLCGAEIAGIVSDFVISKRLGRAYASGTGFRLRDDTVRAPDFAFVRQDRVDAIKSKGFAKGAPDLAVEIFSPSDSVRQLMRKVKQYFAAGCHTVWIVYPERREVQVLDAQGTDRLLCIGDTIEAPELLPGFSEPIDHFFE
jgi:Uma2 family endonuclease